MGFNEKMTTLADTIRSKTNQTKDLTLDEMATSVESIEAGIDTSDATASADEILQGETAYVDGEKVTGTFTIDNELTTQDNLITQIQNVVKTKVTPSGTDTNDATATENDILNGKIAYVKGHKVIGNIVTKEKTAYMPSTENQIIESGVYLAGEQVLVGDENLIPKNIAEGVSIFGVAGTHSGGSGGGNTFSVLNNLLHPLIINGCLCEVGQVTNNIPIGTAGLASFFILLNDLDELDQYVEIYQEAEVIPVIFPSKFSVSYDEFYDGELWSEIRNVYCGAVNAGLCGISGTTDGVPWNYDADSPLENAVMEFYM
jgi:hypothetical protein